MDEATPRPTRRIDLAAGWRSKLAISTTGGLAFLALTGLLIWLAPFSEVVQVTVLLHTVIALAFFIPLTWYNWRHWLYYRQHPLTHVKLLGYLGVFLLFACAVSGLVLTWQPIFGTRISYLWRAIHQWTTVALVAFVVPHILLIVLRDRKARMSEALAPVWAARR
jgi:cytochrome b subunit of formate dehydrogenase